MAVGEFETEIMPEVAPEGMLNSVFEPEIMGGAAPVELPPDLMERPLGGRLTATEEERNPLYESESQTSWKEFGALLAKEYKELLQDCSDLREMYPRRFTERFELEKRRLRNEPEFYWDDFGVVIKGLKDSHAKMGVALGWSAQAIHSVGDFFTQATTEGAKRPLEAKGRGKRDENEKLVAVVNDVNDENARQCDFRRVLNDRSFYVGAHGTVCLRYYPISPVNYSKNDETGEYEETRSDVAPFLELWPLENVLVTNPELAEAWQQDNVFWITPNARMHEIERNEATWELDENGVNKKVSGRFFDLSKMRGISGKSGAFDSAFGLFHVREGTSTRDYTASAQPLVDMIEVEGLLPSRIINWVLQGDFTWQMAMDAGIDVGVPEPVTDDDKREFAARLLKIRWWNVSFLRIKNVDSGSDCDWQLIECYPSAIYDPESITKRVNSLFVYGYLWNELEFYKTSIPSSGYRVEDAADLLHNIALNVADFNGDPAILFNRTPLRNQTNREAFKLLRKGEQTESNNPMVRVSDIVQVFEKKEPSDIPQKIANYKNEFESLTAVLPTIKHGSGDEQTLGELQINQARAQSRLHGILARMAVEDMRLFKSMFEDQWKLRGPENFTNWVIKISGRNGADMEGIYASLDGLWEDYDLIPSTSFVRDRMSMTQAIEKGVTIFGGPQMFNMNKTAAAYLELNGLPDASTILLRGYEPISPEDKHAQLAQGNWIQPSPTMPLPELMLHLASDIAMMNSIVKHTSGFNPKEENILFLQLEKLIPIEQQMQNNMLAILAQMGEAGGGIPGMMGVTGAGGTPSGIAGSVGMPAVQGGIQGGMAPQDRGGGGGGGRPSTVAPDSPVRQAQ